MIWSIVDEELPFSHGGEEYQRNIPWKDDLDDYVKSEKQEKDSCPIQTPSGVQVW